MSNQSVEVFYSYAHKDEPLRNELEKHLSVLQRNGLVSSWHDRQIEPGMDWAQAIDTHLETASIILLLISSDFLASEYCYGIEMKRALEREKAKEARVIPIVLRPAHCDASDETHQESNARLHLQRVLSSQYVSHNKKGRVSEEPARASRLLQQRSERFLKPGMSYFEGASKISIGPTIRATILGHSHAWGLIEAVSGIDDLLLGRSEDPAHLLIDRVILLITGFMVRFSGVCDDVSQGGIGINRNRGVQAQYRDRGYDITPIVAMGYFDNVGMLQAVLPDATRYRDANVATGVLHCNDVFLDQQRPEPEVGLRDQFAVINGRRGPGVGSGKAPGEG